jgi:hypothetical protein
MQISTKSKKWLLLAFGITMHSGCNSETKKEKPAETQSTPSNKDQALEEIKKEPKVKEAVLTEANVIYAGVEDDGTRRDGYAEYLCGILSKHSVTGVRVKIVKFGSTNDPKRDNAYGVLLGESACQR